MKTKANKKQPMIAIITLLSAILALLIAAAPAMAGPTVLSGEMHRMEVRAMNADTLHHLLDLADLLDDTAENGAIENETENVIPDGGGDEAVYPDEVTDDEAGPDDVVDEETDGGEEVTDEPGDEQTDEPGDEQTDEPGDEQTDEPGDQPTDEPGDEPGDEPADEGSRLPFTGGDSLPWQVAGAAIVLVGVGLVGLRRIRNTQR